MASLGGVVGELRMTLEITRAATGKVETVELIGLVKADEEIKEGEHDTGTQHDGA